MSCHGHYNPGYCVAAHTNIPCTSHADTGVCSVGHTNTPCTGHAEPVCPAHDTTGGGEPCPGNVTTFTDDPIADGAKIRDYHFNELRTAIDDELTRRSDSWPVPIGDPGAVSVGTPIDNDAIKGLRNGIDEARTWSWPSHLDDAELEETDPIYETVFNSMIDAIQDREDDCICYCNYACTCDCNYACTCLCNYVCTCVCNYSCTCLCNYACTCVCNYSCTCNCNYSDKRLKQNIVYL